MTLPIRQITVRSVCIYPKEDYLFSFKVKTLINVNRMDEIQDRGTITNTLIEQSHIGKTDISVSVVNTYLNIKDDISTDISVMAY